MDSVLDARQIMANIYALAKIRKIKIGELEKAAKVSAGYLSRLNNDENTTIPNVEILSAIAWRLLVPVDVLIKSNVSQLTGGEQYVLKLLDKLILDTVDTKIDWEMDTKSDFLKALEFGRRSENPLISLRPGGIESTTAGPGWEPYYKSHYLNSDVDINGNCFRTHIPYSNAELYLMDIAWMKYKEDEVIRGTSLELYMGKNDDVEIICSSEENQEVEVSLLMLYKNILDIRETMGIDKKTRAILDHYLNEEPELPF